MAQDWSDDELAAAVEAYRDMVHYEATSKPYSKRQIYRDLAEQFGRTEGAFEYRMQNISAVLQKLGQPWLQGLRPAANVGAKVTARLSSLLEQPSKRSRKTPKSEASYKRLLPAIRNWLIEVARARAVVRYGDLMSAFGVGHRNLRRVMDFLGHQAENRDEPVITALIVGKTGIHWLFDLEPLARKQKAGSLALLLR